MEAAGEVQHVTGANRDEEIGGIVDFYQRKTGNQRCSISTTFPAIRTGHRVIANILTSIKRIHLTLGNPGSIRARSSSCITGAAT